MLQGWLLLQVSRENRVFQACGIVRLSLASLDLQLHHPSLCLRLHMAFLLCLSALISVSYQDTLTGFFWSALIQFHLFWILSCVPSAETLFPNKIKSHSEVPGGHKLRVVGAPPNALQVFTPQKKRATIPSKDTNINGHNTEQNSPQVPQVHQQVDG